MKPAEPDINEASNSWSGKLAILVIFGTAIGMAALAWWFQYNKNDELGRRWGFPTVRLIQNAPQAELWLIAPAGASLPPPDFASPVEVIESAQATIDGQSRNVLEKRDIIGGSGWLHARNLLNEDYNYDFSAAPAAGEWAYVLVFRNETERVFLAFDLEHGLLQELSSGTTLQLNEPARLVLVEFFDKRVEPANVQISEQPNADRPDKQGDSGSGGSADSPDQTD
ncbi:hypothetical protein [Lignipirellula cremea]|uniref:Uncharacterized protein n=1 Tax=Lignipirellula cremea TaxID=2528010 RepID=A0A518DSN5_9BACT|nr:hypothetical protein [Lignipirellula cremea]QDU94852.1 hypothetical protein Pla8534_26600 [Lignipirellula cremea]